VSLDGNHGPRICYLSLSNIC